MPEIGWIVTPVPRCATPLGRLTPDRVVEAKDPQVALEGSLARCQACRIHPGNTPITSEPGIQPALLHDEPRASSTALGFFAMTTRRVRAGPCGCR
jgi:hypothetical protein